MIPLECLQTQFDLVKCDEEDSDHVQDNSWLSLSDVVDHSVFIGHKNLILWSSTM